MFRRSLLNLSGGALSETDLIALEEARSRREKRLRAEERRKRGQETDKYYPATIERAKRVSKHLGSGNVNPMVSAAFEYAKSPTKTLERELRLYPDSFFYPKPQTETFGRFRDIYAKQALSEHPIASNVVESARTPFGVKYFSPDRTRFANRDNGVKSPVRPQTPTRSIVVPRSPRARSPSRAQSSRVQSSRVQSPRARSPSRAQSPRARSPSRAQSPRARSPTRVSSR